MRVGEYGITYRFGASYDMNANTALSLTFTAPTGGTTFTVDKNSTPAVELETLQVTTERGTFAANESVKYVFAQGDIDVAGDWTVQLTYTDASKQLISDSDTFTVEA